MAKNSTPRLRLLPFRSRPPAVRGLPPPRCTVPLKPLTHTLASVDFHKNSFAEKKNLRVFTEKLNLTFKAPSGELTTLQVKPWETIKKTKRMLAEMTAPKGAHEAAPPRGNSPLT